MAQIVYQIASSAALPVRLWVLAGSSSCTLPRRTAPSVTSALGLSRHPGGCLPSPLCPLAVVLFRPVGPAPVSLSCGSKNCRRYRCAQVQRQLNRSAATPVLAQATGNIVGELRTAAPADERRKQLLCGARSLRAATLGLVYQLLVITRGPEVPRGEAQQLTAALAFGQPSEDLRARLRVAVFGLPYQDGIVCKLLIRTHCCIPPRNPGSARCAVTSCCQLDGLELRKGFISVAERGRFELPKLLRVCRFSRPVQSTALPPLRSGEFDHSFSFYQAAGSLSPPGAPPPAVLAAVFSGIAFSPTAAGPGDRTTAGRTPDQRESAAAADHPRTRGSR